MERAELFDLGKLASEISEAHTTYEEAKTRESHARNESTTALNRLNELQRQFDRVLGEMKKRAPGDSDWKRAERESRSVPVAD
jgi:hypothetical protein